MTAEMDMYLADTVMQVLGEKRSIGTLDAYNEVADRVNITTYEMFGRTMDYIERGREQLKKLV